MNEPQPGAWSAPALLLGLVVPVAVPGWLVWRRGSRDPVAREMVSAVAVAVLVSLVLTVWLCRGWQPEMARRRPRRV